MYARRRKRRLSPDRVDAWVSSYQEEEPRILGMPGFLGTYLFADRATGEGQSLTFWESREAMGSSRSATDALGAEQTAGIGLETISIESLEVIAATGVTVHPSATHAVVLEGRVDPVRLDAARARAENRLLPPLRETPGLLGAFLLAEAASGKTIAVSLYDETADLGSSQARQEPLWSELMGEGAPGAALSGSRRYEIIARTLTPTQPRP